MSKKIVDKLGDYMKSYEAVESSRRAVKGKPLIVRLDGRSFHTFTKGLTRPFDKGLTTLMQMTMSYLVDEFNAVVGYTQSDEITLIWNIPENSESQYIFDGRYQKIASVISAATSVYFNRHLAELIPSKATLMPVFDARAFQVDSPKDAVLALIWRENDAVKNSITMHASAHFSHKSLQNVGSAEKKTRLQEIGDPWELMPTEFKRGTYIMKVPTEIILDAETLKKIPEKHRPESGKVVRLIARYTDLNKVIKSLGVSQEVLKSLNKDSVKMLELESV